MSFCCLKVGVGWFSERRLRGKVTEEREKDRGKREVEGREGGKD